MAIKPAKANFKPDTSFSFGANVGSASKPKKAKAGRKRAKPGKGNPVWSGKRAAGFRQSMFGS